MPIVDSFTIESEEALTAEFMQNGYIIRDVEDREALDTIRHQIIEFACEYLGSSYPEDEAGFLNSIHEKISTASLNEFRLDIFSRINALSWFRPTYFALGRKYIESLTGSELAMQRQVNLSIQMPDDDSSLLETHIDSFSGETPFQLVQWIPLVDTYDTKAMYIFPPSLSHEVKRDLKAIAERVGMDGLFEEVKDQVQWLSMAYGKTLIFTPNILHGNIVNRVPETRWSFNSRFTGLFTPYPSADKSLGGFYLPITTKTVSRLGMKYRAPEGFQE